MVVDQVLQWLQIIISLITLGGVAFALGRMFERLATVQLGVKALERAFQKDTDELKTTMYGRDGKEGVFVRRSENELMLENADRARAEFDNRLNELSRRLGAVESRVVE